MMRSETRQSVRAALRAGLVLGGWTLMLGLLGLAIETTLAQQTPDAMPTTAPSANDRPTDPRWKVGEVLFQDDFQGEQLDHWQAELEDGGTVAARDGKLVIDVPAGCTVWFEPIIEGPVMIEYEATVMDEGGPNDRVSDLNCFWMARDARSPEDIFETHRSGKFADYNQLLTYYVGLGGNSNSTTRFRRYIGSQDRRPLLPEHDLGAEEFLLKPNETQTIRLIASDGLIQYYRDGRKIFEYIDPEPYTSGWFGFRTVSNHMEIDNFRVYRLQPTDAQAE